MPTFEHVCDGCGEIVEELVRTFESRDRTTVCPRCGGGLRQRLFPPAIFMGKMPLSGHRKWKFPGGGPKKP